MKEGEVISQRTYMHDPWSWTIMKGLPEGGDGGWVEVGKGIKTGDNSDSIHNKMQ